MLQIRATKSKTKNKTKRKKNMINIVLQLLSRYLVTCSYVPQEGAQNYTNNKWARICS